MAPIVTTRPQDSRTGSAAGPGLPGVAGPSDGLSEAQVMVILLRISGKLDTATRQLESTPQAHPRNMRTVLRSLRSLLSRPLSHP